MQTKVELKDVLAFMRRAREKNLKAAEVATLIYIASVGDVWVDTRVSTISQKTGYTKQRASQVLSSLHNLGLIERVGTTSRLTDVGKEMLYGDIPQTSEAKEAQEAKGGDEGKGSGDAGSEESAPRAVDEHSSGTGAVV